MIGFLASRTFWNDASKTSHLLICFWICWCVCVCAAKQIVTIDRADVGQWPPTYHIAEAREWQIAAPRRRLGPAQIDIEHGGWWQLSIICFQFHFSPLFFLWKGKWGHFTIMLCRSAVHVEMCPSHRVGWRCPTFYNPTPNLPLHFDTVQTVEVKPLFSCRYCHCCWPNNPN